MQKILLNTLMILGLAASVVADESVTPPAAAELPVSESRTSPLKTDTESSTLPEAPASKPVDPAPSPEVDPDVVARQATEYPVEGDEWREYALGILEMEMQEVIEDLASGKPKPPAQVTQPRIISRLDVMITELEKKCGGGKGSNNSGNKPAEKSVLRKGKMKDGEMRAVKNEGDRWADIPAKEREKILQSQGDGFPAGYEDVLADYFRKLSRSEKPASATSQEKPAEAATPPDGTN